jgi:hypothetical protein
VYYFGILDSALFERKYVNEGQTVGKGANYVII